MLCIQQPQSSGELSNAQVGPVVLTSRLNAAQAEEISLLSREVQNLCGKLALDFIQLSHTEATFRIGAQAHKPRIYRSGVSSHASVHGTATQRSGEETWLHINSLLFHHTINHQEYMVQLIKWSQEAIQALHESHLGSGPSGYGKCRQICRGWFRHCPVPHEHASNHYITTGLQHGDSRATRVYSQGTHLRI